MNILLINYEYPPIGAGAATASWNLARELAKKHKIGVLTAGYNQNQGWSKQGGVRIYRCRCLRKKRESSNMMEMASFLLCSAWNLSRMIHAIRPDVLIVFFSLPCGPLGALAQKIWKVPYVVCLRGGDVPGMEPELAFFHRLFSPVRKYVLDRALAVTAPSSGLKAASEKVDPVNVTVIENGVDTDFFSPLPEFRTGIRPFTFLFVGRFQAQKNLFFMIEQLSMFKKESGGIFRLFMVGDGPLEKKLRRFAEKLGLGDLVFWRGWIDRRKLRNIYRKSDCLLNLSMYEGMSNVILEAMATGLPVIASRVPGNSDLVKDKVTGLIVELHDPRKLRDCLRSITQEPQKARKMGLAARAHVVENFGWPRAAEKYTRLIERGVEKEKL